MVHPLRSDWLKDIHINVTKVYVVGVHITYRYMLITQLIFDTKYRNYVYNDLLINLINNFLCFISTHFVMLKDFFG